MAYTTEQLITDAFYAAEIVSREFETVSGSQISDGLRWLNEVLGAKVIEPYLIPYESQSTFSAVIGQEDYTISDLISIDTLTFLKDDVRFPVNYIPRNQYRGNYRVETITTLPYEYFYERQLGGAKISLYFLPDEAYTFTITGVFRLANVSLGDDLESTLDTFYITYLKYALANKICTEYAQNAPMRIEQALAEYEHNISKSSRPLDMSVRKYSTLQNQRRLGWGWVNLGKGFLP
jgi:hypothetical protein